MSTQILQAMRVSKGDWRLRRFPEAASESFKRGQPIYLVGGKVTVVATDGTSVAGLAMEDASGVTDYQILIAIPHIGSTFIASVYHATPASAITAITQPGTRYALLVASNKAHIDIADESNRAVLVTDIILPIGHAVGDVYGLLECEFLDEVLQLSGRDNA